MPSARPDPDRPSSDRSLADAVAAVARATDALPDTPLPGAADAADERRRYLRDLEERGALRDVDEGADLSALPAAVTHVRYPDGRVRRVGYT